MQFKTLLAALRSKGRSKEADYYLRAVTAHFHGVLSAQAIGELDVDDIATVLALVSVFAKAAKPSPLAAYVARCRRGASLYRWGRSTEMPTLTLSGSLSEIRAKLHRIKEICLQRSTEGWSQFNHAFEYQYNTADGSACPKCIQIDGKVFGATT
jgi:hypothetical protein